MRMSRDENFFSLEHLLLSIAVYKNQLIADGQINKVRGWSRTLFIWPTEYIPKIQIVRKGSFYTILNCSISTYSNTTSDKSWLIEMVIWLPIYLAGDILFSHFSVINVNERLQLGENQVPCLYRVVPKEFCLKLGIFSGLNWIWQSD